MLRLHVRHDISFFVKIVDCLFRQGPQCVRKLLAGKPDVNQHLDHVSTPDPSVNEFVLAQDVKVDAGVPRLDLVDLGARPAALPQLHLFGRYVNGERVLRVDDHVGGPYLPSRSSMTRENSSQGLLNSALMNSMSVCVSSGTSSPTRQFLTTRSMLLPSTCFVGTLYTAPVPLRCSRCFSNHSFSYQFSMAELLRRRRPCRVKYMSPLSLVFRWA